jgi:hypothetical protein
MARGQSDADFERVNTLVAGGMRKMHAFAAVAEERGVSANGVRVNYYNASRRANSTTAKSPRTATRRRTSKRRTRRAATMAAVSNGTGNIDDLAARLIANIEALAKAVSAQNRELVELRDRVDRARDALG